MCVNFDIPTTPYSLNHISVLDGRCCSAFGCCCCCSCVHRQSEQHIEMEANAREWIRVALTHAHTSNTRTHRATLRRIVKGMLCDCLAVCADFPNWMCSGSHSLALMYVCVRVCVCVNNADYSAFFPSKPTADVARGLFLFCFVFVPTRNELHTLPSNIHDDDMLICIFHAEYGPAQWTDGVCMHATKHIVETESSFYWWWSGILHNRSTLCSTKTCLNSWMWAFVHSMNGRVCVCWCALLLLRAHNVCFTIAFCQRGRREEWRMQGNLKNLETGKCFLCKCCSVPIERVLCSDRDGRVCVYVCIRVCEWGDWMACVYAASPLSVLWM